MHAYGRSMGGMTGSVWEAEQPAAKPMIGSSNEVLGLSTYPRQDPQCCMDTLACRRRQSLLYVMSSHPQTGSWRYGQTRGTSTQNDSEGTPYCEFITGTSTDVLTPLGVTVPPLQESPFASTVGAVAELMPLISHCELNKFQAQFEAVVQSLSVSTRLHPTQLLASGSHAHTWSPVLSSWSSQSLAVLSVDLAGAQGQDE